MRVLSCAVSLPCFVSKSLSFPLKKIHQSIIVHGLQFLFVSVLVVVISRHFAGFVDAKRSLDKG